MASLFIQSQVDIILDFWIGWRVGDPVRRTWRRRTKKEDPEEQWIHISLNYLTEWQVLLQFKIIFFHFVYQKKKHNKSQYCDVIDNLCVIVSVCINIIIKENIFINNIVYARFRFCVLWFNGGRRHTALLDKSMLYVSFLSQWN